MPICRLLDPSRPGRRNFSLKFAATHRDLQSMTTEQLFREDLWYRLAVFPIRLPPLRERTEDIPALARHFAERSAQRLGVRVLLPSAEDIEALSAYAWPGNVRELAAVIERAVILGDGKRLEIAKALGPLSPPPVVQFRIAGPFGGEQIRREISRRSRRQATGARRLGPACVRTAGNRRAFVDAAGNAAAGARFAISSLHARKQVSRSLRKLNACPALMGFEFQTRQSAAKNVGHTRASCIRLAVKTLQAASFVSLSPRFSFFCPPSFCHPAFED